MDHSSTSDGRPPLDADALRLALKKAEEEVDGLCKEMRFQRLEMERERSYMQREHANIRREREEIRLAHQWTKQTLEAIELERKKADEERRKHAEILSHLLGSRSWRWTLPMRNVEALLRRAFTWKTPATERAGKENSAASEVTAKNTETEMQQADEKTVPPYILPLLKQTLSPPPLPTEREQTNVSVIVAARNYGRFLGECLHSIQNQTVLPQEIIYADDGSDDDSVAVASAIPGVRVLALPHKGAPAARNAGAREATGAMLLFVDGDDMLPPDFLEKHLKTLRDHPESLFAFGPAQGFGLHESLWEAPDWSSDLLWLQNSVNTSALVYRRAFEMAGGWREDLETMWDWALWLRITQMNRNAGAKSPATLLYRRHDQSWGYTHEHLMSRRNLGSMMGNIRRSLLRPSIGSIVSGRLPELFPEWIDALAMSVEAASPKIKPELVLLDNSENGFLADMQPHLDRHRGTFRSIVIVPYHEKFTWENETERRDKVSVFLSRAYNRLLTLTEGEVLWLVEDDIVVPRHAYGTLLHDLTDGLHPKAAVSGFYKNRHMEETLSHVFDAAGNPVPVAWGVTEPMRVDLTGTGCLMIFRPLAGHSFRSHWRASCPAHDWAWCEDVAKAGEEVWLDPTVVCHHHTTVNAYV
jgi:glycosyltransferase involved in cell wall biosynthesis